MSNVVWPTLSGEGFLTDPSRILNTSFAHTLASDVLQSSIYCGEITSMTDIIVENQANPLKLIDKLESSYTKFYNKIFDSTDVTATYVNNPDSSYSINLAIIVTKDNLNYSLSYTAPLDNSSLLNALKGLTA